VFSGTVTFVLLKLVDWTIGIRSGEAQESEGLDLVEHGEKAYHELI
jgi:Amt family ammonium transporter